MDSEDTKQTPPIAPSSIVDLRAELFRKQQEYSQQKFSTGDGGITRIKGKRLLPQKTKKTEWSDKNPGVQSRSATDVKDRPSFTDDQRLETSRVTLEAKTKLYEKMARTGDNAEDEDGNSLYLVDFERKFIDKAMEARHSRLKESKGADVLESLPETVEDVPHEEQWVDFTDSLGRSRRCMRKDLPKLQSMDANIKDNTSENDAGVNPKPDLMSADMHREMLREKWEKEQREMLANQDTVHYSNVQFDEQRSHGVGFYQFSKDETERQKEMETLRKISEDTVSQREAKQKLKDKRKALLNARLEKVRMRRLAQGKPVPEQKVQEESADEVTASSKVETTPSVEDTDDNKEAVRKKSTIREWDLGKPDLLVPMRPEKPKGWINPRDLRDDDFAPPSFYYDRHSQPKISKRNKINSSYALEKSSTVIGDDSTFAAFSSKLVDSEYSLNIPIPGSVDSIPIPGSVASIPIPGSVASIPIPGSVDSIPIPGSVASIPILGSVGSIPIPGSVDSIPIPGSVASIPIPGSVGSIPIPGSVDSIPIPGDKTTPDTTIDHILKSLRGQS